jgi:hypothetical protein
MIFDVEEFFWKCFFAVGNKETFFCRIGLVTVTFFKVVFLPYIFLFWKPFFPFLPYNRNFFFTIYKGGGRRRPYMFFFGNVFFCHIGLKMGRCDFFVIFSIGVEMGTVVFFFRRFFLPYKGGAGQAVDDFSYFSRCNR